MFFNRTTVLAQNKSDITTENVTTSDEPSLGPADEVAQNADHVSALSTDDEDERTSSIKGLIYDAASNTGVHALPNIARAKSVTRRTFWILMFLASTGELFYIKCIQYVAHSRSFGT